MEQKGLRVNSGKTKVMISKHKHNPQNKTGKFPCGVCLKRVGRNSILCPACKCWVHAKCSGLKGQLAKATNLLCSQCSNGAVSDRHNEEKVMLAGSNLEVVDKFCYLGDMLDAGGGAESSTVTRVRNGWKKFGELLPLLTTKAISLKVDGHSRRGRRGRPRKTWEHVITEDLHVKGIRREVAQNRAEWRSATT